MDEMYERLGTLSYMAPEFHRKGRRFGYDSSVDMWALGVCTYMLISGTRPFHDEDRAKKIEMIMHDPVDFDGPEWEGVSREAKHFCSQLMQKDPAKRLAASDALKHRWITKPSRPPQSPVGAALDHSGVVEALQSYSCATKLKRLALEAIALKTPSWRLSDLRRLFVAMDADGSGTLSLDEFRGVMASKLSQKQADHIFRSMDLSHAGEIDYSEFLSAAVSQKRDIAALSIAAAFSVLDKDHDGYITAADLHSLLGKSMTKAEAQSLISSPSVGARRGRIAFTDFKWLVYNGNVDAPKPPCRTLRAQKSEPASLDRHVALGQTKLKLARRSSAAEADFNSSSSAGEQDTSASFSSSTSASEEMCLDCV